jgi:hypothetical protein
MRKLHPGCVGSLLAILTFLSVLATPIFSQVAIYYIGGAGDGVGDPLPPGAGPGFSGYFTSDGTAFSEWYVAYAFEGTKVHSDQLSGSASADSLSASGGSFSVQITLPISFASAASTGGFSSNQSFGTVSFPFAGQEYTAGITAISVTSYAPAAYWTQAVPGNWSDATNWDNEIPPDSDIDADFETGSTTPYTVTLAGTSNANNLNVQGDNVTIDTAGNTLNAAGAVNIGSGGTSSSLVINDSVGGGSLSTAGGVNVSTGAQLGGDGTIIGNVTNAGTVQPGTTTAPGAFYIGGNYTQQSTGLLNVRIGAASGTSDSLQITGTTQLSGTLSANYTGGFTPDINATYTIMSANAISGTFNGGSSLLIANGIYTLQQGAEFLKVNYSSTSVTVQPTDVITFFDESALTTDSTFGHTFIGLTNAQGHTDFEGFYSANVLPFTAGTIQPDTNTPWNYAISFAISASKYSAVTNLINQDGASPPTYSLVYYNCTNWIASIAQVAGITLPNIYGPSQNPSVNGTAMPSVFGLSLKAIGNGNTENGGTVSFAPTLLAQSQSNAALLEKSAIADLSPTMPLDFDYGGVEQLGHTDPSAVASAFGMPLDQVNLGTVNANSVTGLSLSLVGADPTEDVISMNWGDGSAYDEQSLTFSHIYAPGTYIADLLDVDDGAVHSYDMTVDVSSAPSTPIEIDVTAYPIVDNPNPGLVPFTPISIPEPLTLSGIIGGGAALLFNLRRRAPGTKYQLSTNQK